MEPKQVLQTDYLDLIYNHRNKAYGGYELRKHYNRRIGKAASFFFLGLCAIVSFSFVTADHTVTAPLNKVQIVFTAIDIHTAIPKAIPRVLPPVMPASSAATKSATFIPEITHDNHVPPDAPPTEIKIPGNTKTGTSVSGSSAAGTSSGNTNTDGRATTIIPSVIIPPAPPAKWVSQMPEFNGELSAYLAAHLKYPEVARSQGIQGQVIIQFVVNEDGSVSDAKVVRGIGGGCDEEALRMTKSMPKWKPGKQNGTAVKVFFILPVRFELS